MAYFLKSVCEELLAVTTDMSGWLQSTLPVCWKNTIQRILFNADETTKFYHCMLEKTLALKNELCSGGKN